jgi:hypothetical protein
MRINTSVRALLLVLYAVWMAFWFWFFSFQYGSGFFQYHLDTRLPFLALSLLAVAVAPLSGYFFISCVGRGAMGIGRASLFHVLASTAPLGLFGCVSAVWMAVASYGGRPAFEADEAMGIGIDFMVCVGVVLLSYLVVGPVIMALAFFRSRKGHD